MDKHEFTTLLLEFLHLWLPLNFWDMPMLVGPTWKLRPHISPSSRMQQGRGGRGGSLQRWPPMLSS